jgi:hypothetical protein
MLSTVDFDLLRVDSEIGSLFKRFFSFLMFNWFFFWLSGAAA